MCITNILYLNEKIIQPEEVDVQKFRKSRRVLEDTRVCWYGCTARGILGVNEHRSVNIYVRNKNDGSLSRRKIIERRVRASSEELRVGAQGVQNCFSLERVGNGAYQLDIFDGRLPRRPAGSSLFTIFSFPHVPLPRPKNRS